MFGAQAAAYAEQPWETVNYAACHDQEVLFDQVHALGDSPQQHAPAHGRADALWHTDRCGWRSQHPGLQAQGWPRAAPQAAVGRCSLTPADSSSSGSRLPSLSAAKRARLLCAACSHLLASSLASRRDAWEWLGQLMGGVWLGAAGLLLQAPLPGGPKQPRQAAQLILTHATRLGNSLRRHSQGFRNSHCGQHRELCPVQMTLKLRTVRR